MVNGNDNRSYRSFLSRVFTTSDRHKRTSFQPTSAPPENSPLTAKLSEAQLWTAHLEDQVAQFASQLD